MADNTQPVLLLTRPKASSDRFAAMVRSAGLPEVEIVISPLLDIAFRAERIPWNGATGAVFTSRHGVQAALAQNARPLPCFCVGHATAQLAQDAGWPVVATEETAEALIRSITQSETAIDVLHVSGQERRVDVAHALTQAGLAARTHVAYDQMLLPFSDLALARADGARPVVAPLFSPRTARHFARTYQGDAPLWLAALSPAVAEPLDSMGAKAVQTAERPNAKSMVETVRYLVNRAMRLEG